ncbi:MAG: hypothetical protein AAGI01_19050 [Myxococcota bacterium]
MHGIMIGGAPSATSPAPCRDWRAPFSAWRKDGVGWVELHGGFDKLEDALEFLSERHAFSFSINSPTSPNLMVRDRWHTMVWPATQH